MLNYPSVIPKLFINQLERYYICIFFHKMELFCILGYVRFSSEWGLYGLYYGIL